MHELILGASGMACAAIALFFLRFWRGTGDRFFVFFALAFAVFAVNRFALVPLDDEADVAAYAARALAFGLVIVGIVDKNRAAQPASPGPANGPRANGRQPASSPGTEPLPRVVDPSGGQL